MAERKGPPPPPPLPPRRGQQQQQQQEEQQQPQNQDQQQPHRQQEGQQQPVNGHPPDQRQPQQQQQQPYSSAVVPPAPCPKCESDRADGGDEAALVRECSKLRAELERTRARTEATAAARAAQMEAVRTRHREEVGQEMDRQKREAAALAEMDRLTRDGEAQLRQQLRANEQLRREIAETRSRIRATSERADEEMLKVVKLRNGMKKTKRGIKGIFAEDDESYIEIILP